MRIFGLKDCEGLVFDKTGLLDKTCHHSLPLHCQCRMKAHQKVLASAFKHFENVREVTADLFSYPAYFLDEMCGNNVFLFFIHSGLGS